MLTIEEYVCVCVWEVGHKIRPLPCDLQCSIGLTLRINPLLILHFEWNVGFYLWGRHKSHLVTWRTSRIKSSRFLTSALNILQYFPPKRRWTSTGLHDVSFHLSQCFSTAGPRPSSGPWHQLYWAARGSSAICHFHFLSILNVILCLSTCHTVYTSVLILFMTML
jgi:hypothetical protein